MSYMNDGCDPFGVPYTSNFKPKKVKKVNKNDEQYWFNGAIIFKNEKRYEIWEIVDLLNEQEDEIQRLKWSNKILRANKKDCEFGRKEEQKRWVELDKMRIEHIRLLQKRLKENGLSIYVCGDVE